MEQNEIINFFLQPTELRRPTSQERSKITATCGVYAWYSDLTLAKEANVMIPAEGVWRVGDFLLLYIGSVTTRPIRNRLRYHSGGGRADQSQVQMGLGCLLSQALKIELRPKPPKFHDFYPKGPLKKWIEEHTFFKCLIDEEAEKWEKMLISKLKPLLNKHGNDSQPFCAIVRGLEKEQNKRSKLLD